MAPWLARRRTVGARPGACSGVQAVTQRLADPGYPASPPRRALSLVRACALAGSRHLFFALPAGGGAVVARNCGADAGRRGCVWSGLGLATGVICIHPGSHLVVLAGALPAGGPAARAYGATPAGGSRSLRARGCVVLAEPAADSADSFWRGQPAHGPDPYPQCHFLRHQPTGHVSSDRALCGGRPAIRHAAQYERGAQPRRAGRAGGLGRRSGLAACAGDARSAKAAPAAAASTLARSASA